MMPDLKQRRAWRSISVMFACAAAIGVVMKRGRISKIQSGDKIENMISRVYRKWRNQELQELGSACCFGWSLDDLVCKISSFERFVCQKLCLTKLT